MSPTLGVYALTRPASQLAIDDTRDWRVDAACADKDYPFFGPEHEHSSARVRREAEAVDFCHACPVISACLTAALEAEGDLSGQHRFGVVGGMTPTQRQALSHGVPVPALRRPKPKRLPAPKPPKLAPAPRVDRDPRPRPTDCVDPSAYGYNRHCRKKERPCQACSDAKSQAHRARRAEKRAENDAATRAGAQ